jgi:phosphorylase kinase gamma subunit
VLGKGVSSTVRRAVLKETGESFAVKIIDVSEQLVDGTGLSLREQTVREVEVLRLVAGHPNIIQLVDVFEGVTFVFLVFELCVNGELFDHLNQVVKLSEKRARRVMRQVASPVPVTCRQVAEALLHCHRRGVVHRDIKPENILLDNDMNVKLTDFGFSQVLRPEERLWEMCGTPSYLAPELYKYKQIPNTRLTNTKYLPRAGMMEDGGNGYGLEVDVWACGVVLYTLLVGGPPFWHRRQLMMVRQIMEARYTISADISAAPRQLIQLMLTVEPQDRPTIEECLRHEFFHPAPSRRGSLTEVASPGPVRVPAVRTFQPRKVFRLAVIRVRFLVRLRRLRNTPQPLSLAQAAAQPYGMKEFRRVIDGAAFRVYGHWVKRGEGQNRGAMFEQKPKTEVRRQQLQQLREEQEENG